MADNPHGRRRRKRSDSALNRTKLVETARELLSSQPDAEMTAIAAAAGVARSTAYRHFATREELLSAVRTQVRDDAESNDEEHLRPAGELAHLSPSPLSITEVLATVQPLASYIAARNWAVAGAADLTNRSTIRYCPSNCPIMSTSQPYRQWNPRSC